MAVTDGRGNFSTVPTHPNITNSDMFLSQRERAIITVAFALFFVLGFVGNVIVVYVICTLRNCVDVPTNIFILSQAFADLATATSIPIYISHMYMWNWELFYIYTSLVWLASLGSLFLLTLNRLMSVVHSLRYVRRMTPFRAKVLVVVNWVIALVISLWQLLELLVPRVYPNFGRYYILILVLCVVLCNGYMYRESRIQARKIKQQNRVVTGLQKNIREDFRSVKTLALVGGTFLLSCLPFTLVVFAYGDDKRSVRFQRSAAFWGPLMALNSVVDPIIYYFRGAEFRSFYQRFKRLHGRGVNLNSKNKLSFTVFKFSQGVRPCA